MRWPGYATVAALTATVHSKNYGVVCASILGIKFQALFSQNKFQALSFHRIRHTTAMCIGNKLIIVVSADQNNLYPFFQINLLILPN